MVTKITTVSIKPEDAEFLEVYNLSASDLIRNKVEEMREFVNGKSKIVLEDAYKRINGLQRIIVTYAEFLKNKGLTDEFLGIAAKPEE